MDDAQKDDQISQDGFVALEDVKTDAPVEDAQIVSESPSSQADQSNLLTSLDEMIKSNVQSIDRLRVESRKLQEMIQDGFENDAVYKEHDDAVKAATKIRQATKGQIMKQPAVLTLVEKLKTLKSELKEKQLSLSDYLLEYQRVSGANQIEMEDGEVLEIVNSAKIVRKAPGR